MCFKRSLHWIKVQKNLLVSLALLAFGMFILNTRLRGTSEAYIPAARHADLIKTRDPSIWQTQSRVVGEPRHPSGRQASSSTTVRFPGFKVSRRKIILFWTTFWWSYSDWGLFFADLLDNNCAVSTCDIRYDRRSLHQADAVVFHLPDLYFYDYELPVERPPGQIWILFCLESPPYPRTSMANMTRLNGVFNWTMSYRWDSEVTVPYGLVLPRKPNTMSETAWRMSLPKKIRQVLPLKLLPWRGNKAMQKPMRKPMRKPLRKRRLVAWMASNCEATSGRSEYIAELQKYVYVDVYGNCGKLQCGTAESVKQQTDRSNLPCHRTLSTYKFYLAFENSLCPDYVTEKFFRTLTLGVVPIVMGGVDYSKLSPEHSFIDALQYQPHQLAQLLTFLDGNDTAYGEYFRWQESHVVIDSHPLRPLTCGLCSRLSDVTGGDVTGSYDALDRWYDAKKCWHWSPNT